MKTLNELLHQDKLVDIEKEISLQFAQLQKGYYDAKMSVMLCIIATESINALENIDQQNFPDELKKQFEEICNTYRSKACAMKQHMEENSKLIKIIDKANADYPDIENKIKQLLSEFDEILKKKVEERDAKPLCDL